MNRFIDTMLARRRGVLVVAALMFLFAGSALRDLEFNFSFWKLFVSDHPEVQKLKRYQEAWGEDAALVFVVLRSQSGNSLSRDNVNLMYGLEARLAAVPGVVETASPLSVVTILGHGDEVNVGPVARGPPATQDGARAVAAQLLANPLVAGNLVSANGRTSVIMLRLDEGQIDASYRNPLVERVTAEAEGFLQGSDLTPYLTGIPVAQWIYSNKMVTDLRAFTGMAAVLLGVILLWIFRSWMGLVLPFAAIATATTLTMATIVWAGESINMLTTAIPTLMLVIGIADAIHLVAHYRQRIAGGMLQHEAVRVTFRDLGWSCLLTSVTTAVGFLSLVVADIVTVRQFGLFAAVGIAYAFLANMLIVPAGLLLAKRPRGLARLDARSKLTAWLSALSGAVCRAPVRTLLASATVLLLAFWGATLVKVESRMFEEVPDDDPVVVAHRVMEQDLPGVVTYALDVTTPPGGVMSPELLAFLDDLGRFAEADPAVDRAMGLAGFVRQFNVALHGGDRAFDRVPEDHALVAQMLLLAEGDATARLVNADASRTRVYMRGPEVTTSAWEALRAKIEDRIGAYQGDAEIVVTGGSAMAQRALGTIVRDVLSSLFGATLIICAVMSLLFRSLRLGLVSMIPNLIPLLITVGVMGFAGINLRTSTVVIFSISLGLAVDDTIHFLVRYGRERAAGTVDAVTAVHRTMAGTGRPIVYTSVLLMGGFWILLFSNFYATRDVGLLGGVTLLSALFADLIVLPALLVLMPRVGVRRDLAAADCSRSRSVA